MEWIKIEPGEFSNSNDILLTDGTDIYLGWLFVYEGNHYPTFLTHCGCHLEKATHWMPLPKLPEN